MSATYTLMKKKIAKSDLTDKEKCEELLQMLDTFYIGERISNDEYKELVEMIQPQESEEE